MGLQRRAPPVSGVAVQQPAPVQAQQETYSPMAQDGMQKGEGIQMKDMQVIDAQPLDEEEEAAFESVEVTAASKTTSTDSSNRKAWRSSTS